MLVTVTSNALEIWNDAMYKFAEDISGIVSDIMNIRKKTSSQAKWGLTFWTIFITNVIFGIFNLKFNKHVRKTCSMMESYLFATITHNDQYFL